MNLEKIVLIQNKVSALKKFIDSIESDLINLIGENQNLPEDYKQILQEAQIQNLPTDNPEFNQIKDDLDSTPLEAGVLQLTVDTTKAE